jgi:hypothetical protein
MEKKEGQYILDYESSESWSEYNEIVITLETVVDKIPEEHVLEGMLIN